MKLCLFEDDRVNQLYPLTLTRPGFDLRWGACLLVERLQRAYPGAALVVSVRDYLAELTAANHPEAAVNDVAALSGDDVLFINARWLILESAPAADGPDEVGLTGDAVAYIRAKAKTIKQAAATDIPGLITSLQGTLPKKEVSADLASCVWDLVLQNGAAVKVDFAAIDHPGLPGDRAEGVVVYGDESQVYVAPGATLHPFVVLDTHHGPVMIDQGAEIHPFTRIEGPSYIGRETIVVGAKIREGTSIGPVCRVGGEIEESIIQGYTNKYHEGFLGHAFVGEWVNLGAGTNNSDLKNDYSEVEVQINGVLTQTGSTKVGCAIGDHSKTSIGTQLNTGTIIGTMANVLAAGGILPKTIPSFCWFIKEKVTRGQGVARMIETAATVKSRRGLELTEIERAVLWAAAELTAEQRRVAIRLSFGKS